MHYAVIDVETTGLFPSGHDRIVEIAIICLAPDLTTSSEYSSLLNPGRDIGPTWLHGIRTREVLGAPEFLDVAGDISGHLRDAVVVGHNVAFDLRFLESEFGRGGFQVPRPPYIDTLSLALRAGAPNRRLEDACAFFGIDLSDSHSALGDARATTALFCRCLEHFGPEQVKEWVVSPGLGEKGSWPSFESRRNPCPRRGPGDDKEREISYLASLVRKLPASHFDSGDWHSYFSLLDRALEDRRISNTEANSLGQVASETGLSGQDIQLANQTYLTGLIDVALKDGVLSTTERRDIEEVAQLLGLEEGLEGMLQAQASSERQREEFFPESDIPVNGKSVCFTGALNACVGGERVTRERATAVATEHGMVVQKGVTKKLDYLVIADPDSLSGKAQKARKYGTRILAETVFWHRMGVDTDD